jgi:hypothetical protein
LLRQRRENDKKYVRLKRVVEILELLEEDWEDVGNASGMGFL